MVKQFKLFLLDLYRTFLHPGEIVFMIVCDFLFLVPAYILCYVLPEYKGEIIALFFLAILLVNSMIGLPLFIKRDQERGWLFQLATVGVRPENYYIIKIICGFFQQLIPAGLYLLISFFLFSFPASWLLSCLGIMALSLVGLTVVNVITLAITPSRDYILYVVLALPLLVPLFLAGYILFVGAAFSFRDYPWAWVHWLLSYDLIMLATAWYGTEFLWEEFL
jgi:ABC-type transport system involved in cytochrome c biogenesis permease component